MRSPLFVRCLGASLLAAFTFSAQAADLTVSAAASLTNAFKELGPVFEAQHLGTTVLFNFAASDALLAQIAKGAPVDVFASADQEAMDRAEAQKLLSLNSRRNFVGNSLVLIAPTDSANAPKSLDELRLPAVKRIAIGNPASVPAGRYAKGAFDAAKLWPTIEPKAVMAQSVRQALDYVARGEVDAGLVYGTDAAVMKDKVRVVATIPTTTAITYPIATIGGSPNPEAARQFIEFLFTPPAQTVLARYGFQKP